MKTEITNSQKKRIAMFVVILIVITTVIITCLGQQSSVSSRVITNTPFVRTIPGTKELNVRKTETTTEDLIEERAQPRTIVYPNQSEKCKKRLPRAIIAGIMKSGTGALLKFLSVHPQVAASTRHEDTKYFTKFKNNSLDWYKGQMPCSYSSQITIEKTAQYFYCESCPRRIRQMNPNTKIIIIVKDPIARAESMFAMLKDHGEVGKNENFEDAITINDRTQINDRDRKLIQYSNYPEYMGRCLNEFSLSQILIVDGHNLELNPSEELNKVENFLQIGNYFTPDKFALNETKGKFCLTTDISGLDCLSKGKGRTHPIMTEDVRTLMEDYFKPINEEFFKLVHKRLSWGY